MASNSGSAPMAWQAPTLEIAGREYSVRRLGMVDIQRVAKIYSAGAAYMNRQVLAHADKMSPQQLGTFILDFIPYAMDEVIDFFASILSVSPGKTEAKLEEGESNEGTIRDPNIFPLGAEIQVIEALIEHEDVLAFFDRVKTLGKSKAMTKLTKRLSEQSTESKKGTAGKTATLLEED